jgi:WD40 repeat protein
MANFRFIGCRPYVSEENYFFFGRNNISERLYQNLLIEETAVLYGQAGSGKSSTLNAGIKPLLKNSGRFEIIQLDFNEQKSITTQLALECDKKFPQACYLDKLTGRREHIWYFLKKIQSQSPKIIVLLLDNFDAGLRSDDGKQFREQLQDLLEQKIPEDFITAVENNRKQLSEKGKELLKQPVDLKMIWTAKPEAENKINSLKDIFGFNPKNSATIKPMQAAKANEIIKSIAAFESPYKDQNNFKSAAFNIPDAVIDKYLEEISDKPLKTCELQIFGKKAEALTMANESSIFPASEIITAENATEHLFNTELKTLFSKNSEYRDFLQYLTRKPKESPVPYKNIPDRFSENFSGIVESRLDPDTGGFLFQFKSAVLEEHLPDLLLKHTEKQTPEKYEKILPESRPENKKLHKKLRYYQLAAVILLVLAIFGIMIVNRARKTAQDNKQLALSNMYAAYSYKNADTDPTLSFRYAQKAYEHYPENHEAYSALLNAYYNTEVFYSMLGNLPENRKEAVLSPDGKYLLAFVSQADNTYSHISLHDTKGNEIKTFENDASIFFAGFSKDAKQAIFADTKGKLFLYSPSGDRLKEMKVANSRILHAELSKNQALLVLSEESLSLRQKSADGNLIFPQYDYPYDMACISNDGTLVAAGADKNIYIYNERGDMLSRFELTTGAGIKYPRITAMSFSPDKRKLLTVVNDMFTKASQIIVSDTEGRTLFKYGGHSEWIRTADFSEDGTHIVTAAYDKTSVVLDEEGNLRGELKGHKSFVSDAVFFENNETVISVSDDATIRRWKFGRLINPLAEIENIDQAIFSPSGLKILTVNDTLLILRNIFGEPEINFNTQGNKIKQAAFAKNGEYIYGLTHEGEIIFWSSEGKPEYVLNSSPAKDDFIDFYSDSAFVLSLESDSVLLVRDVKTDKPKYRLRTNSKINHACFRQKDGSILTAEASGELYLRKLNGELINEYEGHAFGAQKAVFSPDENKILSTGADKTTKLQSLKGELLHKFPTYNSKINSADFSPDNRFIITASDDNKIRLYTVDGRFTGSISYPGKTNNSVFSADGDYIITIYSNFGKNTAKLQHISPEIILRYVNEDKIFGNIQEFDIK